MSALLPLQHLGTEGGWVGWKRERGKSAPVIWPLHHILSAYSISQTFVPKNIYMLKKDPEGKPITLFCVTFACLFNK